MLKKFFVLFAGCFCCAAVHAQKVKPAKDSTLYYEDLFSELAGFLDSLTAPRSMVLLNVGVGNGVYNFQSRSGTSLKAEQKINITPSVGFFHKSGLGINGSASIIKTPEKALAPYQFAATGSYDYLRSMAIATGIGFTRFFTKDSLSFYTSPLQNEVNFYLQYKRWWSKPSLTVAYGWGSRKEYSERKEYIKKIRKKPVPTTQVVSEEHISDLSVALSFKHDFYWHEKLGANSSIRLTPQVSLNSGTQRFGFNQKSSTAVFKGNSPNVLFTSESVQLDDTFDFRPLSTTMFLKSSFSFGSFSLQPQVSLDYYFPATEKNLTTGFVINAALVFD